MLALMKRQEDAGRSQNKLPWSTRDYHNELPVSNTWDYLKFCSTNESVPVVDVFARTAAEGGR